MKVANDKYRAPFRSEVGQAYTYMNIRLAELEREVKRLNEENRTLRLQLHDLTEDIKCT